MDQTHEPDLPLLGFGIAALVLGFVGTLFFFMPILGIPVSLFALACGVIGLVVALATPNASLRWSLGGIALALLALGVNVAMIYAPEGDHLHLHQPEMWQKPRDRPYVSPPAGLESARQPLGNGPA